MKRTRIATKLALSVALLLAAALSACQSPAATTSPEATTPGASSGASEATPSPDAAQAPEATPSPASDAAAAAYPVTVTDLMGRTVTLEGRPERVASLTPSNTEIVCALGAQDRLAGVDDYSDYPESVTSLPKVGDYSGPNIEAILAQNVDVVLSSTKLQADVIQKLEEVGLTVIAAEATTYAQIDESIALVAKALGVDAAPTLDAMAAAQDAVAKSVAGADAPTVYFAVSFGEMGNWTCGKGSFIDDMIDIANGRNVAKDGGAEWMEWSLEKLLADNPEVILVSGDQAMADAFVADPAYAELSAVKNGKIYPIDANTSSRPSPRIVEALEAIAKALHPAG